MKSNCRITNVEFGINTWIRTKKWVHKRQNGFWNPPWWLVHWKAFEFGNEASPACSACLFLIEKRTEISRDGCQTSNWPPISACHNAWEPHSVLNESIEGARTGKSIWWSFLSRRDNLVGSNPPHILLICVWQRRWNKHLLSYGQTHA